MDDFLGIYLRDQLALGVVRRELARRARHNNRGTELGAALARVATAIAEEQLWTTLRDLAGLAHRLPDIDFDHLIDRAKRHRAELEPFRVSVGTETLGARADR